MRDRVTTLSGGRIVECADGHRGAGRLLSRLLSNMSALWEWLDLTATGASQALCAVDVMCADVGVVTSAVLALLLRGEFLIVQS